MKNIALFLLFISPVISHAGVTKIEGSASASVNGTDITPTSVTATLVTASSITTTGGTGITIKAASGVGSSGQGFLDLTNAGYGPTSGTTQWIGNTGGVLAQWASATHRFYVNGTGSGKLNITSTGVDVTDALSVAGSTFTVANTGVVSAPSQPSMQLYLDANITAPAASQTRVHWSATASNRASWRKNVVFDTVNSSDVFKTNGAGGYYTECCISSISGGSSYLYTLVRSPGSTVWLRGRSQNPGSTGEQTVCAKGILELPDADELVCEIQASAQTTINSGVGETTLTFMKVR